jgi:hypothetical protein
MKLLSRTLLQYIIHIYNYTYIINIDPFLIFSFINFLYILTRIT